MLYRSCRSCQQWLLMALNAHNGPHLKIATTNFDACRSQASALENIIIH